MRRKFDINSKNQQNRDLAQRLLDKIVTTLDAGESEVDVDQMALVENFENYRDRRFSIALHAAMRKLPGLGYVTLSPISGTGRYRVPGDKLANVRVNRKARQGQGKLYYAMDEAKTLSRTAVDIKIRESAARKASQIERHGLIAGIVTQVNKSKKKATAQFEELVASMTKKSLKQTTG